MKTLIQLVALVALPLVLLAVLVTLPTAAAPLPAAEGGMDGKAIFLAQKCNLCHSVSTAGIEAKIKSDKMKGPDLVGVLDAEHDAEWIGKFLHKQADLEGKKHAKEFTGSDEELTALIDWLAAQKK
jgi:mono/diheme cytochrome c family protein